MSLASIHLHTKYENHVSGVSTMEKNPFKINNTRNNSTARQTKIETKKKSLG